MKHKHAEIIAEWINDTSRLVEVRSLIHPDSSYWTDWRLDLFPKWYESDEFEYRFKNDQVSPYQSSLTDNELIEIWTNDDRNEDTLKPAGITLLRRIAEAAAKRERNDIRKLPAETSLSDYEIEEFRPDEPTMIEFRRFSRIVIARFLRDLKKGLKNG